DQAASNLNDEGWKPADGTEWTADKLKTALESKEGRETLAPEKAEDVIARKLRKDESEWIERELERINAGVPDEEKIDAGTVEASRADIRDSFIEKVRSEGLVDPTRAEEAEREIADYFEWIGKEEGKRPEEGRQPGEEKRPAEDIKYETGPKAEKEELTGQELAFQLEEKKREALVKKLEQRAGERRSEERLAAEGVEEKARGRRRTQQERREALADRHDEIFAMDPEDMTRAEMDYLIITDDFTGLGSKTAYRHSPKKAHQSFVDLDSLKWVNDSVSHRAGDEFLASMGEALKATDLKTDSYHISGDEFYVQADRPEQIKSAMDQAYKYLETHPITIHDELGREWEFPGGFSYGIGKDIGAAERAQKLHKGERELQGKRAGRGVQPPGIRRKASELSGDDNQREVFSKPEAEKVSIETLKANRSLGRSRITEDADGSVHVTFPGNVGFKVDFITNKADQGIELVTSYGTFPKQFKDKVSGAYLHKDKTVLINTDEAGNPTITHEFTHFLEQSGYFESRDIRILNLSAKKYGLKMDAEGRAETLAKGFEERDQANTFLKQVMQKVTDFVDMVYNAVGGRTTRGIMRDIESGKIFKQEPLAETTGPAIMYSLGETIDKTAAKVGQLTDRVTSVKNAKEGVTTAFDGLKRLFYPAARSEDAQRTAEILIEQMGHNYKQAEQVKGKLNVISKQYSKATTVTAKALDLMNNSTGVMADGLFNRMSKEKQYKFIENIQTDQKQATPELQGMADTISKMFDDLWKEANEVVPGSTKYRENYFPGMWEKPTEAKGFFSQRSRSLEGTKAHTKAKVFDTIADGIAAGYVPRGSPLDMAFEKLHDMQKYITAHRVLNDMVTDKTAMLVKAGEKAPNGYQLIPEPYGVITKRLQLKEGEFEEVSYRYAAKDDVSQVMKN
ncbi:MAG: diguanylate cyclase, partial [Deltaproteobacteria bacterium]|nr:diguanylate cyclase [Deltaproteobacteria bacterium]